MGRRSIRDRVTLGVGRHAVIAPTQVVSALLRCCLLTSALVLLAACSGGGSESETVDFDFSGDAASVNGVAIPASSIAEQLDVLRAHPDFSQGYIGLTDVDQVGRDQPSPVAVATVLSGDVLLEIARSELDSQNVETTTEDREGAETLIRANFGSTFDGLPEGFRQNFIERNADLLALDRLLAGPPPSDEAVRAEYDLDPDARATSCVRHILFADLDAAGLAKAELDAGADFDAMARERSLDTGSGSIGGDLGCLQRGQYVEAFDDAVWASAVESDADRTMVRGPVETEFGVHVFVVYDRRGLTFDEVRDDIALELTAGSGTSLGTWLGDPSTQIDVVIDERFGSWDPELVAVEPLGSGAQIIDFQPGVAGDEDG